jgi:predicted amidohydrolase YtcJ
MKFSRLSEHLLLLYNGRIVTMDTKVPRAEAVAIHHGRFVFVGTDQAALARFPEALKVDLEGRTACPGFVDSHCHFMDTGISLLSLSVADATSVKECIEMFREATRRAKQGEAIIAYGIDETRLKEHKLPNLEEMDAAVPERPLFCVYCTGHGVLVNSRALAMVLEEIERMGLSVGLEDQKSGFVTGWACFVIQHLITSLFSPEQRIEGIRRVTQQCLRKGVTTVHALEGWKDHDDPLVAQILEHRKSLPLDVVVYYQTMSIQAVQSFGLPRIGGCFRCALDGDFAPHTAALRKPYADDPGTRGILYYTQDQVDAFMTHANRAGLQISIHAVGDAAIDQALTGFECALRLVPRSDHRHRIEHFEIPDEELVERARNLGVVLGMQPAFDHFWDYEDYERYLGPERALRKNSFRMLLDRGLVIGGGCDSFVTPINPILGIHSCVNHSVPESRINLSEAIRMFTIDSAYIGFEDENKGSVTLGKQADLAILSEDIYMTPPENLKRLHVVATFHKGNLVWKEEGLSWYGLD